MKRLVLLAAALLTAHPSATPSSGWQTTQAFVGVTYAERFEIATAAASHACRADRSEAPGIRFKVSPPGAIVR